MKRISILVFFALFLPFVSAIGVSVTDEALQDVVGPLQEAQFIVHITNEQDVDDSFKVDSFDIYWELSYDPEVLDVEARSTETVVVTLVPIGTKSAAIYDVPIVVSSVDNREVFVEHVLKVKVVSYTVQTSLIIPSSIDPRRDTNFEVKLENRNSFSLSNLTVRLKSDFFDEETNVNLMPNQLKNVGFLVSFDDFVKEGSYKVVAEVYDGEDLIGRAEEDVTIGFFPGHFEVRDMESGFLIKKLEITRENKGNSVVRETYTQEISSFKKFFTSTEPEPSNIVKEDGFYVYEWVFEIEPGESKVLIIETNYRTPSLYAIIIVILLVLIYFYTKKDLVLSKSIVNIGKTKDGVSTVKIMLSVKNKGRKLKNVRVMDRLMNVTEAPEFGIVKPSKIIKRGHSVELIWNLDSIASREERVFSYRVRSKFPEKPSFSVAAAKYMRGGRAIIVRSNRIKLFS